MRGGIDLAALSYRNSDHTSVPLFTARHPGLTAFHYAASRGHAELAGWLLEHGADAAALDASGRSPLHLAAMAGQPRVCAWLVDHCGLGLHTATPDGLTALHFAALGGHVDVLQWFAGAAVPTGDDGPHRPSGDNDDSIAEDAGLDILASNGAPPAPSSHTGHAATLMGALSVLTKTGMSALHLAAMKGHVPALQWLTAHGLTAREGDSRKRTPLHLAVAGSHDAAVRWLLESGGANPRAVDADGTSPLALTQTQLAKAPSEPALLRIKEYMTAAASPPAAPAPPVELRSELAASLAADERRASEEEEGEGSGGSLAAGGSGVGGGSASTRPHPAVLPPPGSGVTPTSVFIVWEAPPRPPAGPPASEYTVQFAKRGGWAGGGAWTDAVLAVVPASTAVPLSGSAAAPAASGVDGGDSGTGAASTNSSTAAVAEGGDAAEPHVFEPPALVFTAGVTGVGGAASGGSSSLSMLGKSGASSSSSSSLLGGVGAIGSISVLTTSRTYACVSGLAPATSYSFRVRAKNGNGWGVWGAGSDPVTTSAAPLAGVVVTTLAVPATVSAADSAAAPTTDVPSTVAVTSVDSAVNVAAASTAPAPVYLPVKAIEAAAADDVEALEAALAALLTPAASSAPPSSSSGVGEGGDEVTAAGTGATASPAAVADSTSASFSLDPLTLVDAPSAPNAAASAAASRKSVGPPQSKGRTLLHVAASANALAVLKYLLGRAGGRAAIIDARDAVGATPLLLAVVSGHMAVMKVRGEGIMSTRCVCGRYIFVCLRCVFISV